MHQGEKEIPVVHIENANKAIIPSNNNPLLLRCNRHLQYNIGDNVVSERALKLHGGQRVEVEPIEKVGY